MVAICAVLGAVIEAFAAVAGPQGAGVGTDLAPGDPNMPLGPLIVGLGVAAVSAAGGILIIRVRRGLGIGLALLAAVVIGALVVAPFTGWFLIALPFTFVAGVVALFVRPKRSLPAR
jgi:hypothetical protein